MSNFLDKHYDLYFTGSTPQHLRIHFFDADPEQRFRIAIYMGEQYRYDVYYNEDIHQLSFDADHYIKPLNAEVVGNGKISYTAPSYKGEFLPSIQNGNSGDNYVDQEERMLYVLVKGPGMIDIKLTPQVIIGFNLPAMSEDEFFNSETIIANLAAFLQIPDSKIRIMSVVPESSRRKKRDTSGIYVVLEIGDYPEDDTDDETTDDDLADYANSLKAKAQKGEMDDVLGTTVYDFSVQDPLPNTDSEDWEDFVDRQENGETGLQPVYAPNEMILVQSPEPSFEGSPFVVQPSLKIIDAQVCYKYYISQGTNFCHFV